MKEGTFSHVTADMFFPVFAMENEHNKDNTLRVSFDIPARDYIHQYQYNKRFIIYE